MTSTKGAFLLVKHLSYICLFTHRKLKHPSSYQMAPKRSEFPDFNL